MVFYKENDIKGQYMSIEMVENDLSLNHIPDQNVPLDTRVFG